MISDLTLDERLYRMTNAIDYYSIIIDLLYEGHYDYMDHNEL